MKWVEKYAPQSLADVVGNGKIKDQIETWASRWLAGEAQKPLLLVGPPGVGKTTIAHLVGKEYFSETIEVNASDKRSYDLIQRTVGESSKTRSLFHQGYKLIIIDEVDGISGRHDRSGGRAINETIKTAKQPVILMANDPYSKNIASIKNNSTVIKFTKIRSPSINAQLRRICQNEGINFDPDALMHLSRESAGDLRSAITSLEAIVDDEKSITMDDVNVVKKKDTKNGIFDTLTIILKSKNPQHIKEAMNTDAQPQFLIELLAENIPREYEKPEEVAKAYDMISLADINLGRAFRTQNYVYWKYAFLFMGRGVANAKHEKYHKFGRFVNSTVYARASKARKQNKLIDAVTQKMSVKLHTSPAQLKSQIPYYKEMFKDNEQAYDLKEYFKLTDDEVKLFRPRKIPASIAKKREKELQKQQKMEVDEYKKQQEAKLQRDASLNNFNINEKQSVEAEVEDKPAVSGGNLLDLTDGIVDEKPVVKVEKTTTHKPEIKNSDNTKTADKKEKTEPKKSDDKPKSKQTTLFDF